MLLGLSLSFGFTNERKIMFKGEGRRRFGMLPYIEVLCAAVGYKPK